MSEPDEEPRQPWTARPRPASAAVWETVPLDRGFATLAQALRAVLVIAVMLVGARVVLSLWGIGAAEDDIDLEGAAWRERYDSLDQPLTLATAVVLTLAAALWLTWQYRLARSSGPGELTRSPVWHVTSWFIPVAALWWPYQNVRDLWWRRSGGWGAATVGWWWSALIAVLLIEVMVASAQDNVASVEDFRDLLVLESAASLAALIAGVLALMIHGRLSDLDDLPGSPR